ncbi:MAG: DNA-directed RNA polymerase subunit K [Candidatus Pacearchaeota archaeon]
MIEKLEGKFSKYEVARILGARSLQLAMDAPVLLKLSKEEMDDLNYDSLKIAEKELEAGILPISVRRPLPKKSEKTVKKLTEEEIKERLEKEKSKEQKEVEPKKEAEEAEAGEETEEKKVKEEGEIMELAQPDDEVEVEESDSDEEVM